MNQKPGYQTAIFGEWLYNFLKNASNSNQYSVYFDHGDRLRNRNVVAIKGLYGGIISRQNQLAEVDVMVVKSNNDIVLLIEIEESESPPKKIIGDITTLLMCNRFCIRLDADHHYYKITPETELIMAGVIDPKGSKKAQLESVILPRLKQFTLPKDGINPNNLSLFFDGDLVIALGRLKNYIGRLFK